MSSYLPIMIERVIYNLQPRLPRFEHSGYGEPSSPAVLRATGTETITTEHRPARRRFKGHAVGFAALIADDLKFLAFRSASLPASAAKVRPARIAAGFATLRMSQSALAIIILFSFTKGEGSSAFGASDFKIWHRYLPRNILSFVV